MMNPSRRLIFPFFVLTTFVAMAHGQRLQFDLKDVHVGEKRPQIEAVLGKPSKELGAGLGAHHGLCNTCAYTQDGWSYVIDYLMGSDICTGIAYLKVDQSPISIAEMQQLLVWNCENQSWFMQPGNDPKLVTYLRADKTLTAWFIGGRVVNIDMTALLQAEQATTFP